MADKATLEALLERVEAATGPDREIDADMEIALHYPKRMTDETIHARRIRKDDGCVVGTFWRVSFSGKSLHTSPEYTRSIDAALALVERVLPGWHWSIYDTDGTIGRRNCQIEPQGYSDDPFNGVSTSTPLAILAALLKALIDQEATCAS